MTATSLSLEMSPVLPFPAPTTWPESVWIGEVWRATVEALGREREATGQPVRCRLRNADSYRRARLLVRSPGRVHGFIDLDVSDGELNFADLTRQVARAVGTPEPGPDPRRTGRRRSVTVVICTRDRPHLLVGALEAVLAQDFTDFNVVVVDNASATSTTAEHVQGHPDPRVRLVVEPNPGVARARNTGLREADGDIVAFVDDDAVVDRFWLTTLLDAFDRAESVGCVSGLVPAGEIRTPAQAEFDRRTNWSVGSAARVFDWNRPPHDVPLFPFAVGEYGTGANFALDREAALRIDGFDNNLGAGAPTCGGEDLDIFFRILRSGRQLVLEPAAVAWHRHRDSDAALEDQMRGYGMGLGAWLAKIAGNPATAALAAKVVVTRGPALRAHLRTPSHSVSKGLVLRGAWEYGRARLHTRREAPVGP